MDKLKETGEICFGPLVARKFEGQKDFDKYWIERVVKQVVKKTGDGEDDFILVDKIIETKKDIAKEIHAQAGDAGIEAYIRQYETEYGVNPLDVAGPSAEDIDKSPISDFTKMPGSLADAVLLGENARKLYASLPSELKGKMSMDEFVSGFTQEKFDKFIASLVPPKKEEEGKTE